ncbi:nucleotidyltransferase [Cohnella fermenti]|uniref:Nucleotidyltransferase n=2 Tax=Cohnella fermenti TaxID=2565925 RepID=A0A4S4BTT8_9BACL|nr:nucleotidyltransferase [Cohnella fermenti]
MNKMDIQNTLQQQKQYLRDSFYVDRIGLFGSFLRDEQTADSDIDLLVEFSKPVGFEFIELKEYLEGVFGKLVDLVTPNALRPFMKDNIISEVQFQ